MKVSELIERLQKMPQDAPVSIFYRDNEQNLVIRCVSIYTDGVDLVDIEAAYEG